MFKRRASKIALLRFCSLLVCTGAVLAVGGEHQDGASLIRAILLGYGAFFVLGTIISWRQAAGGLTPFLLLAGDLIGLGAIGGFLAESESVQIPFLTGYLVSTLVAIVGRSRGAMVTGTLAGCMVLGTLSGSMVLGLGTAVLSDPTATPFSFLVLAGQVLILAAAALETAFLSDWINDDLRNRLVDGERMRAVGQTLAGVTHELSNPLSALVGYADMLAERVEGGEAGELVGKMRDQADRAAHILRCMRKFVRQQHSETAPFSAGALLNDVLDLFAYKARILGVSVSADVGEELAHVYADKQSVQQVLVNLHQNALQAVQKVEGERFVRIRVFEEDGEIWFCWRDNGHGIPEEIRKHVFEPFFTTKAPEEGTGLGLSISRGIARGQGGELHLEPDTGVGACFTLKLPRAASASESRPRQKSQVPDLHDLQVLVVDDEEHVRDTLGALVGKLGHVATCVDGVRGAENAIAQTEFDAILLDLRMPGKSGRAFYRTLTSLSPHIVRRVILMTGDVANADIAELADTWDTPILLKPFTQCELVEALALTVKASTATGESAAA